MANVPHLNLNLGQEPLNEAENLNLNLSLGEIYQQGPRFFEGSSSHADPKGKGPMVVDDDDDDDDKNIQKEKDMSITLEEMIENEEYPETIYETNPALLSRIVLTSVSAPNTHAFRQALRKFYMLTNEDDGFSFAMFKHDEVHRQMMDVDAIPPILAPERRNRNAFRNEHPGATSSSAERPPILISLSDFNSENLTTAKLSDDNEPIKMCEEAKHLYGLVLAASLIDTPKLPPTHEQTNPSTGRRKLDPSFEDARMKMASVFTVGPNRTVTDGFFANRWPTPNPVIVCHCHGDLFSVEQFVAHAGISGATRANQYINIRPDYPSE
ncbi:hypothetical protein ACFE04_009716 [Oxalis oulophora]